MCILRSITLPSKGLSSFDPVIIINVNIPVKYNACVLLDDVRNLTEDSPCILKSRIRPYM